MLVVAIEVMEVDDVGTVQCGALHWAAYMTVEIVRSR